MSLDLAPLTAICQALADPTRLRIAALLGVMELSVGELVQVLGQSQPRVSRHVRILAESGLVERRKEGSWVFLALARPAAVGELLAAIDAAAGGPSVTTLGRDRERLDAIRRDRAEAAARYFEARAGEWDQLRSLHVAETEVETGIARLLAGEPVGRLVDIGTGTGRMLELFAGEAASAIGIDRSSEMLRLARAKLDQAGIGGVSLRQADMYSLPLDDGSADLVLLHQVLHYAQLPADALAEAARLLAPGGRLLLVDFAPHDREELRRVDAHRRLGFDDRSIVAWLKSVGLSLETADELSGGALTVKIWLARKGTPAKSDRVAA